MEDKDFKTLLELAKTGFPKMPLGNGEALKIEGISQKYSRDTYEVVLTLVKNGATCGTIYGISMYAYDGMLLQSRVKLWWFGVLRVDTIAPRVELDSLISKVLNDQGIVVKSLNDLQLHNLEPETLKMYNDLMALNNGLCE